MVLRVSRTLGFRAVELWTGVLLMKRSEPCRLLSQTCSSEVKEMEMISESVLAIADYELVHVGCDGENILIGELPPRIAHTMTRGVFVRISREYSFGF